MRYLFVVRRISNIIFFTMHGSEAFTGKASEGEGVALYFEPSVTPPVEASGSPSG